MSDQVKTKEQAIIAVKKLQDDAKAEFGEYSTRMSPMAHKRWCYLITKFGLSSKDIH